MQEATTAAFTGRRRVEAVVESLAAMHDHGGSLAELTHDARNMVTALSLYCDLLEEPGILGASHRHYASELRLVAEGSRRLVEKLALLDGEAEPGPALPDAAHSRQGRLFAEIADSGMPGSAEPGDIEDLSEELLASRNLLGAIAGPSVRVTANAQGGAWPVAMTGENLIRALVNLVRNSAESMAGPGAIDLTLDDRRDAAGVVRSVILGVEDSGPGMAAEVLNRVFEPGFTTRTATAGRRRGLGLSITRSIVEAAGGRIQAGNRDAGGARFVIELPVAERRGTRE